MKWKALTPDKNQPFCHVFIDPCQDKAQIAQKRKRVDTTMNPVRHPPVVFDTTVAIIRLISLSKASEKYLPALPAGQTHWNGLGCRYDNLQYLHSNYRAKPRGSRCFWWCWPMIKYWRRIWWANYPWLRWKPIKGNSVDFGKPWEEFQSGTRIRHNTARVSERRMTETLEDFYGGRRYRARGAAAIVKSRLAPLPSRRDGEQISPGWATHIFLSWQSPR